MVKILNANWSLWKGEPASFTPPGTLIDLGKVAVTMRPATTEHEEMMCSLAILDTGQ